MLSVEVVVYGALVYTLAGFVKGVVGLGLPTISLALLVPVLGLKEDMACLLYTSPSPRD